MNEAIAVECQHGAACARSTKRSVAAFTQGDKPLQRMQAENHYVIDEIGAKVSIVRTMKKNKKF